MNNYGMAHRVAYGHGALNKVQVVEERHEQTGTGGHIKILVILVMFLLLMMIASIIISVVSLSHWNRKDGGQHDGYDKYEYEKYKKYYYDHYGSSETPKAPWAPPPSYPQSPVVVTNNLDESSKKDVYTIAFGSEWDTHEYIDESQQCALRGWGLKVVLEACKAAGLTCKTMYAPYSWCIDYFSEAEYMKHPVIGKGLLNKGITACSAWFPDAERTNVALFSDGYVRNPKVFLCYPDTRIRPALTSSTRIGFIYSSPNNEKCLKRYVYRLTNQAVDDAIMIPFDNVDDLMVALNKSPGQSGAVDLVFLNDLFPRPQLDIWSEDFMTCARGPAGLVANKRHKAFIEKWNVGLEKIKGNGVLKEICDHSGTVTGDGTWCVKTYWV